MPVSRPSAPSPLGEPCNRVYSGVFLSSFRSSLVAAGAGHYSLLRLQMKPRERLPWGLGITVQRYGLFRDYANFPATFFHGLQIETFPPLNRSTSRGTGRSGDGFGGVFPPAVAVVAVVAVILKP